MLASLVSWKWPKRVEGKGKKVAGTPGGSAGHVFMARLVPGGPGSVTGLPFLLLCMCASAFIQAILFLLGKPILLPLHGAHPFVLPRPLGDEDAMATVGLSQHLFDCALLMLQKAGSLNLEITGQLVRAGSVTQVLWQGVLWPILVISCRCGVVGSGQLEWGYRLALGRNPWIRNFTCEAKRWP